MPLISTPPFSDGMLSANEEIQSSSACVEHNSLRKDTSKEPTSQTSVSSVSKPKRMRSKSPVILVNRLTDQDLRLHGVRNSSISPTDLSRPKKRPRLNMPPTTSASIAGSSSANRVSHISKGADSRPNGTRKVVELFGDDSDDSEADTTKLKETPLPDKTQTFNPDALDYDFEVDEEEDIASSNFTTKTNEEIQPQNKKKSENHHRSKSSKSNKKEKSSEKDKRNSKDKKKKDDQKSNSTERGTKSTGKSRNKEGTPRKEKEKEKQKTSGKQSTFRIPRITNPVSASFDSGQSVGLPFLVQQNLEQNLKGSVITPSVEVPLPSVAPDASSSNHDSLTNSNNTANPLPILGESSDAPFQSMASSETFQLSAEAAPPILCIVPSKRERTKSVGFGDPLSSIRNMSPRDGLPGTPLDMENEGKQFPKELINNYVIELEYEPESSPRPPVTGIRPL